MTSLRRGFALRVRLLAFLARRADTEDAVAVMQGSELVAAGYYVLKPFYLFAVELDQRAALRADQMIVVSVFVVVLVKDSAVVELKLTREPALFQQLQGPVHGCESDRRVSCFHDRVKVFARHMAFRI
jgi:hypothetical protein